LTPRRFPLEDHLLFVAVAAVVRAVRQHLISYSRSRGVGRP
jgi:hypothetical protein